jgi:tRNA G18 (ribose-2'-O)-methylase SpoU
VRSFAVQHLDAAEAGVEPRLAPFRNLTDRALREAERWGKRGVFIAESELVVRQLLASGHEVASVLCTPTGLAHVAGVLRPVVPEGTPRAVPVLVVPQAVLEGVVGFDFHRGVLACGVRPPASDPATLLEGCDTLTVLEGVVNHDNMGGIFRVVGALAGRRPGVVLSPSCVDPLYRKSLRTSVGQALRVPFATVHDWPGGLEGLRSAGFTILAMTTSGRAEPISERARRTGGKIALLLGAEGPGLTAAAIARADAEVTIPMREGVDSLNVHVAAGVAWSWLAQPPQPSTV